MEYVSALYKILISCSPYIYIIYVVEIKLMYSVELRVQAFNAVDNCQISNGELSYTIFLPASTTDRDVWVG